MEVPNIKSKASLNISGFISSSLRISTPGRYLDTCRQQHHLAQGPDLGIR
jgi:hypothetical protein